MRTQDIAISVLLHIGLLAVLVIASSVRSRANQFNPEDIATVQIFDNIPAGTAAQTPEPEPVVPEPEPVVIPDLPSEIATETVEPEPVKLASIETPAEIETKKIKKKPPKKEEKPKPMPVDEEKKTVVGEGEVSTSIGADDGGGTGLGVGEFPYNIRRVTQLIDRNWTNPVLSQRTLSCVIYFQVDRTGQIISPAVEKSSGNNQFDMHALSAVIRTKELPPLPISYAYDVLGFHLEFEYKP